MREEQTNLISDLRYDLDNMFDGKRYFVSMNNQRLETIEPDDAFYFFTPVEREDVRRFFLAQTYNPEKRHNLLGFYQNGDDISLIVEDITDHYDKEATDSVVSFLDVSKYSGKIAGLDELVEEGVPINNPEKGPQGELSRRIRDAKMSWTRYPPKVRMNAYWVGGENMRSNF